jgi:hypothetical protein
MDIFICMAKLYNKKLQKLQKRSKFDKQFKIDIPYRRVVVVLFKLLQELSSQASLIENRPKWAMARSLALLGVVFLAFSLS